MQGNKNVMKYTGHKCMTREESKADLQKVIDFYVQSDNTFWVWAIERKTDKAFVGTCAIVKNASGENEIGFRLLDMFPYL